MKTSFKNSFVYCIDKLDIMKKLFLLLLLVPMVSFGQISFECENYKFTVYEDDTPLKYNFMAGDDIDYDYQGRVESIGNVDVDYDYQGRIESIGGMNIEYDYNGRLSGSSGRIDCNW